MLGPVTKYAILGIVFGVVSLTLWGVLSGQFGALQGAAGGLVGGLVGGAVWGVGTKLASRTTW
jgi:hypothetical protein